jgi:hypothetical protein
MDKAVNIGLGKKTGNYLHKQGKLAEISLKGQGSPCAVVSMM